MNIHHTPTVAAASMPAAYRGDGVYEMRGLPDGSLYTVAYIHDQFDVRPLSGERYIAVCAEVFDTLAIGRREGRQ